MSRPPQKLKEFLEGFVDEHALADGDELLLDVTEEEARDLGLFFIRGICGWMHGLERVRRRRQLSGRESPTGEAVMHMQEADGSDEAAGNEADAEDALVN
jgi:hypothetical protein